MSLESVAHSDLEKLRRSPHAMASWKSAQQYLRGKRYAPALAAYRKLVEQFPGVPHLWADFGTAAAGDLDFVLAEKAFQRATDLITTESDLLLTVGMQYYRMRRLDLANACHERAVAADPGSPNARLTLASWYERIRRLDDAWQSVQACLTQQPTNVRALYMKGFLLHRQGNNDEAETTLRDLLKSGAAPPDVQANACHLLGVVLDALGKYDEVLPHLGKSKSLRRQLANTAALEQIYETVSQSRRKVLAELNPEMITRWREESVATPSPHPLAFLGGAPRSGTTLIEQVLGAHPAIVAFDEPQAFATELLSAIHPPPPAKGLTVKSLNFVPPAERSRLISRYFKSVLRESAEPPAGKLILDKNPSITLSLHIWLRLFPQSKIIIAQRDPRDVVISCYFQNITLSWGNVSFLGLERTVQFYCDCMDVWLRMRELGGFDWTETRYEDVVKDLGTEGRRVTSFLGLPWDPAQASYYESARHKFVHAPTYEEVTKPVYHKAVGRWKNYATALEPFQKRLAKYCQAFGYAE